MHANVPVRFGRGRLDSLGNKGLAAYLIASNLLVPYPGYPKNASYFEGVAAGSYVPCCRGADQ
jgi:hypothetical protein